MYMTSDNKREKVQLDNRRRRKNEANCTAPVCSLLWKEQPSPDSSMKSGDSMTIIILLIAEA